jgi:regulator of protease activity HflC (stomatin/prohibitin superfamily)
MPTRRLLAIVGLVAVFLIGFAWQGRYEISPVDRTVVWRLDRWTGEICVLSWDVKEDVFPLTCGK